MEKVPFFTPVSFQNGTIKNRLTELVDDYFTLNGRKVIVLKKRDLEKSYIVTNGNKNSLSLKSFFLTAIKILTYTTVALPLFMLSLKIYLRSQNSFYLEKKDEFNSVFCFGDIHGELDGFIKNLKKAKIVDEKNSLNPNFKGTLIQMGDVIDRGPKSYEAFEFLSKIQKEAPKIGSKVVRLLGNHEQLLLEGNYYFANYPNPEKLAKIIRKDVLEGKVQLAYFDNKRLFTHAGMRDEIKHIVVNEIKNSAFNRLKRFLSKEVTVSTQDISDHLNYLLKKAARTNDFSHIVFRAGITRGGKSPIGGVTWEDISEIKKPIHTETVPQIIAHNPPDIKDSTLIRVKNCSRLIVVDAGLCEFYGNNQAFVKLKNGYFKIIQEKNGWFQKYWEKCKIVDPITA